MALDLTGNDYISITRIRDDGALDGINVLHAGAAGLVEWCGVDGVLLRPSVALDGAPVPLSALQWRRLDRWIPTFVVLAGDVSLTGTICAPAGYPAARGFFMRIEADNRGRSSHQLEFALELSWQWTMRCIASSRPLEGRNQLLQDDGVLVLESNAGRGPALAIAGDREVTLELGDAASAENGVTLHARVIQSLTLAAGRRTSASFFIGAGRERDGAATAARVLQRAGSEQWLRQTRLELSHILRAAQDHRWAELLNRNLLFNRFFAVARGIDDDRLYLLRSRVTTAADPAIFNEREALFWTIPALILADPAIAREAMFRTFDLFSERSGEFRRYVDGGAFDPGFSLDQFLLYAWCVFQYINATADEAVLDEPLVRQILYETDIAAFTRLHPQHMLAATELLPSGDIADYPYATTGNALLWLFASNVSRLSEPQNGNHHEKPRFADAAKEVQAAVWHHCVTEVAGHPVLVSSTNTDGDAAVYDDPAMSLVLLPFLGFCPNDDPVWRATVEFLRSKRYPLWRDGAVAGLAGRSDPQHAVFAALCADLIGHNPRDALDRLLRVQLPSGVAAAAYDPATGEASAPYHAALAGFLAWALVRAAEPLEQTKKGRKAGRARP